jgi:hypothetical protein
MANALSETSWKKLLKDHSSFEDPGLADALKEYTKAAAKESEDRLEALEEVVSVAEKAQKLNAKSRNKAIGEFLDEVIDEAQAERRRIEAEEDDASGPLGDEQAYGAYLKKVLKKLQTMPLYFAAGLGTKAEEHRLILHKTQDGKKLLKTLKDSTSLKKFAWGQTTAHVKETSTMTLALEGPQVGGLKKKLELLLKYFKPLPFDTILLMVDGKVVADLPDDDDNTPVANTPPSSPPPPPAPPNPEALRFAQRLKPLKNDLEKVIAGATSVSSQLKELYAKATGAFKQQDFVTAHAMLDQLPTQIKQGLNELAAGQLRAGDPAALFTERLKNLLPSIKEAAGTRAGDEAKLKASEAGLYARNKDFVQANSLLDQVEQILNGQQADANKTGESNAGSSRSTPEIAPGTVQKRKFLLERWARIPEEISLDLQTLKQALERDLPDEDADLLIELAEDYLSDFYVDMKEAIDDDINAGDSKYQNAIQTIGDFKARIATEPLIQNLKKNTLGAAVSIDAILLRALDEVEQGLAS